GVSIGAGVERTLFWFANNIEEIVATDLYHDTTGYTKWGTDAPESIQKYAPFPYPPDPLTARRMDGTAPGFHDDAFDFAYSLSSIEHFGGHDAARRSIAEMCRVVKPGGVVCIVTELVLNDMPHPEYFTPAELQQVIRDGAFQLVEPDFDLRIS